MLDQFRWKALLGCSIGILGTLPLAGAPISYIFTTFEVPGASVPSFFAPGTSGTFANGINDAGVVVGTYTDSNGYHGFIRSTVGSYSSFDVPSSGITQGQAINDLGQVAGWSAPSGGGLPVAFVRSADGSAFTTFNVEVGGSAAASAAYGINDSGQVTVQGSVLGVRDSFLRSADGSTFTPLDAGCGGETFAYGINDGGVIAGTVFGGTGCGWTRSPNGTFSLITGSSMIPFGINDAGVIVGSGSFGGADVGFVRLTDGSIISLDVPGSVVNPLFNSSTEAFGINSSGEIVGTYWDANGFAHGFLATPTPEPSTLVLLAGGILFVLSRAVLLKTKRLRLALRLSL